MRKTIYLNRAQFILFQLMLFLVFSCTKEDSKLVNVPPGLGIIKGVVVDSLNQTPVNGAKVKILPPNDSLYTDSSGTFIFSKLETGQYELTASKVNYNSDTIQFSINSMDTQYVTFHLNKTIPVEHRYSFYVREAHQTQEVMLPQKILVIESEKVYANSYSLIASLSISSDSIEVTIDSVDFSGGFFPSPSTASTGFDLNISEGTYWLSIKHELYQDLFNLNINDSTIIVETISSSFSKPTYSVFWRYPEKSFYYTCGTTTETSWMCCDFLDTLNKYIELEEFYSPEYGEFCYPTVAVGHYYEMTPKYFFYKSESDYDLAGLLLQEYSQQVIANYTGVGLVLKNWKNKSFQSWLY